MFLKLNLRYSSTVKAFFSLYSLHSPGGACHYYLCNERDALWEYPCPIDHVVDYFFNCIYVMFYIRYKLDLPSPDYTVIMIARVYLPPSSASISEKIIRNICYAILNTPYLNFCMNMGY